MRKPYIQPALDIDTSNDCQLLTSSVAVSRENYEEGMTDLAHENNFWEEED